MRPAGSSPAPASGASAPAIRIAGPPREPGLARSTAQVLRPSQRALVRAMGVLLRRSARGGQHVAVSTCPSPCLRTRSEQLATKGKGQYTNIPRSTAIDSSIERCPPLWPAVRAARPAERVRRRNRALIAERACRRACVCRRRVCVSPPRRAACWRAGSCAATMVNIRCAATTCRCAGPVLERAARREQLRSPTRQRISPPALAASRRTHACIAAAPRVSAGKRRSTICQPCRPATSCASPRTTT